MKKIIYTCLLNNKDNLILPFFINEDWEYICFTDYPQHKVPSPWKYINITTPQNIDPIRYGKYYKILPHRVLPKHDINVWMDANFEQQRDLNSYPLIGDVNLFKHFERKCLYDEAAVCKSMQIDDTSIIDTQTTRYLDEGFPILYNNGVFPECGRMFRKNNEATKQLMEFWYNEIVKGSRRDQLSFMYSVWKTKTNIHIYPESRDNSGFLWTPHLRMRP